MCSVYPHSYQHNGMPKKKWLRELTLNVAKGRNHHTGYRGAPDLLSPLPRRALTFKRGLPIFSSTVDTIQNLATGNRQYKPPKKQTPLLTDYDENTCHQMRGKFQFHISGHFPHGGAETERELFTTASDLFLVGFMKVRSTYAMGHLQGDVFALSYMRKWFQDRCNSCGTINNVHIFDDSYGLPELRYDKLECIRDWRSPIRRKQHMESLREEAKLHELERRTRERESQQEKLEETKSVRSY